MIKIKDKEFSLFLSSAEIEARTKQVAAQINHNFAGKKPTFLISMNGALTFGGELMRYVTIPYRYDSIRVRSYKGTESTGEITIDSTPKNSLKGQDVIIVEDIVDTGLTLDYLIKYVKKHGAASVHTVSLLFKKEACEIPGLEPNYTGFVIPNRFVVGHGFDYDEDGRYYPDIYALTKGSR